ncbi:Mitochondrial chaperone BCS1 [Beauveria bassiana]|nr:Mitochondrial chaperone BCS1 [Beauveria bassiana]
MPYYVSIFRIQYPPEDDFVQAPDNAIAADMSGDVSPTSIFSLNELFDNPLFAGGIGLASLGAAAAFARKGVIVAVGAARRRLLVNVEISKQDPAYPWILAWLSTPRPTQGFIASRLTRIHNLSVTTATASKGPAVGGPPSAHFFLQPGYGRHIIKFRNAFIAVNREKHNTANMNTGEPHEIVQLTTLWAHRHIFEQVFSEAHTLAAKATEGKTLVYSARGMEWAPLGEPRKKRPLKSVILDEGVKDSIVGDRTLLLLEDADAAFTNRRQRDADGYSGASVTFSGLLNALDGIAAGEERLAFLTTNHIDRLDPALIRPGRVDMMTRIGEATRYQASEMWDRFYGDVDEDHSSRELFLGRLNELGLFGQNPDGGPSHRHTSTAAIQGLFLFNKNDMQGAINMAEGLVPRKFEASDDVPEGAIKTSA